MSIRNFLSLKEVDVELGPLNVLVGPNAAGKTNLLRVLEFLGDAARTDLAPALAKRDGYARVRFRGKSVGPVQIELTAMLTRHASETAPDRYKMSFREVARSGALVREEEFQFKRTARQGRRITVKGTRVEVTDQGRDEPTRTTLDDSVLGLATLKRLGRSTGRDQVIDLTDALESFRIFEVNVEQARWPTRVEDEDVALAPDASNLSTFLQQLHDRDLDIWAELVNDARAIIPGLLDIEFRSIGGPAEGVVVLLREEGLRGVTYLHEASFGTIRGLALLALLYDPDPPKITCVEEIDHGLHPYALDRVVDLLREATTRTQFLIATHSPILVNRLRASELIVCERDHETGESVIPAISAAEVRAVADAGELALGELWFSGTLGGIPS